MIILTLLYVGVLTRALNFINAKKIIVGIEAINDSCTQCLKFTSLLEGIENSFQSDENVTLELLDFEYKIKAEDIAQYLMRFSNRSLTFKNSGKDENKIIFFKGRKNDFRLSKIIFYEEFFSFNIQNLLQLHIENIHFVFSRQYQTLDGCMICHKKIENSLTIKILIMNVVNFECITATSISLDAKEFSLIDFEGHNFSINLERINPLHLRM